jgi:hypothetical protein
MLEEGTQKLLNDGAKLLRRAADAMEHPDIDVADLDHLAVTMFNMWDGMKTVAVTARIEELRRNNATSGSEDNGGVEDNA